jgi:hypothetical protein
MRRSGFWVCVIIAALACMLAPSLAMADIVALKCGASWLNSGGNAIPCINFQETSNGLVAVTYYGIPTITASGGNVENADLIGTAVIPPGPFSSAFHGVPPYQYESDFNIWDDVGQTQLSDTLQVQLSDYALFGTAGLVQIVAIFNSYDASNPGSLKPLTNCAKGNTTCNIVEQTTNPNYFEYVTSTNLLGTTFGDPAIFAVGFESKPDKIPVLEPSSILLLVIMLAGTALAAKKFRLV